MEELTLVKMTHSLLSALILTTVFALCASATPLGIPLTNYTNTNFPTGNVYATFLFNVPDLAGTGQALPVRIEALSYTGGTTQFGAPVPGGNFDNVLQLFSGVNQIDAAHFLALDDDNGQGLDAMINTNLLPGTYTLAVSQFGYGFWSGTGWSGSSSGSGGRVVSVDISASIPEPATLVLIGAGLLILPFLRRKRA